MRKVKDITIRKAKIEDIEEIAGFAYHMYLEVMDSPEEDFDSNVIGEMALDFINRKDRDILIVENGKAIGMSAVWLSPCYYNRARQVTDAQHIYIDPAYRKSSAIRVLVAGIKNWASNKKAPWIFSRISEGKRFNIKRMF